MADENVEALLRSLHGKLAETLLAKIKSGDCTAADLNVARAFLKDNGIETDPARPSGPTRKLMDALDAMPLDEVPDFTTH